MTVALASVPRQDLGRTADPQPGSALPVHLSYRRCSEVNSASPILGVQASTKDCRRPSLRGNHGQASKNHAGYWVTRTVCTAKVRRGQARPLVLFFRLIFAVRLSTSGWTRR